MSERKEASQAQVARDFQIEIQEDIGPDPNGADHWYRITIGPPVWQATTHPLGALVSSARTGSGSDLWATPWSIVRTACARVGWPMPRLDLAAVAETAKAPNYCGPDHVYPEMRDGLTAPAAGLAGDVAWCNPPWSDVGPWLARCYALSRQGWRVVALVPLRPSTRAWGAHVWPRASEVAVPDGRVGFEHDGRVQPACLHDVALIYYDAADPRPLRWTQMRIKGEVDAEQSALFGDDE